MDISFIKEFVILAETQSFSETAESLYLSQSTISKHIKKIESELNVDLFERSSRKVRLTLEGERFLNTARQITGLVESYMIDLQNTRSSTLFVTAGTMTPVRHMTRMLVAFAKQHPEFKISVSKGYEAEIVNRLSNGQSKVAFSYYDTVVPDTIEKIPFFTDELCVVVPAKHPLAQHDKISIDYLQNEDLVLPETGSAFYSHCMQLCRDAGFVPNVKIQLHKAPSVAEVIECGLCVALYPRSNTEDFPDKSAFKILPLVPTVSISTYMLCLKDANRTSVTGKFIDFVKDALQKEKT